MHGSNVKCVGAHLGMNKDLPKYTHCHRCSCAPLKTKHITIPYKKAGDL